jgi:putative oxidoreductase
MATLQHRFPVIRGEGVRARSDAAALLVLLGRALFVAIFLSAAPMHFTAPLIGAAASKGVPFANIVVPLSGIMAIVGGLMVLFGWYARVGAWLLIAFLIPITFFMHQFWNEADPQMAMIQRVMFMKNLSMLGCAFLITYFGAGPMSLDARRGPHAVDA